MDRTTNVVGYAPMPRKKHKKRRGHYCWCCGRTRPNEQFSGKGHKRHLCRDCAQLGGEELEYRQALRDMERCVDYDGRVFRKRRRQSDTFLHHKNPRIRAAAEELVADRKLVQEEWQQMESEYESYDVVEEVLREIECELAAINLELTEAAEMDRSSGNYDDESARINRDLAEAAEINLCLPAIDTSF